MDIGTIRSGARLILWQFVRISGIATFIQILFHFLLRNSLIAVEVGTINDSDTPTLHLVNNVVSQACCVDNVLAIVEGDHSCANILDSIWLYTIETFILEF